MTYIIKDKPHMAKEWLPWSATKFKTKKDAHKNLLKHKKEHPTRQFKVVKV